MDKLGKILGKDLSQGIMSRMLMADVKENETTSLTLEQTKANGTYVRMLDANGNSVRVARDTFVQAIRDLLPSALSDQSTTATNFLSLLSNGTLGKTTLANLASVLGETSTSITDWDNVPFYGMLSSSGSALNAPAGSGYFTGFQFFNSKHHHTYQVAARSSDLTIYIRVKTSISGSWGSWKKIESTSV